MPFLPPNQQLQSTEGDTCLENLLVSHKWPIIIIIFRSCIGRMTVDRSSYCVVNRETSGENLSRKPLLASSLWLHRCLVGCCGLHCPFEGFFCLLSHFEYFCSHVYSVVVARSKCLMWVMQQRSECHGELHSTWSPWRQSQWKIETSAYYRKS